MCLKLTGQVYAVFAPVCEIITKREPKLRMKRQYFVAWRLLFREMDAHVARWTKHVLQIIRQCFRDETNHADDEHVLLFTKVTTNIWCKIPKQVCKVTANNWRAVVEVELKEKAQGFMKTRSSMLSVMRRGSIWNFYRAKATDVIFDILRKSLPP